MNLVIKTKDLSKKYKDNHGLLPTNFELHKGEVCALIGRNGAGKSTFFKLLANQIKADSGDIELFNKKSDIKNQMRKRIGFMIEHPDFINNFTAFQNLKYFSIQRGISNTKDITEVLKAVELENVNKKFKTYSLGMKQRLGLALALLNGPDLLILDEPINGLDAQGIKDFRNLILRLNQEHGITFLLSSHILNELQQVADRFVFIDKGKIIKDISKEKLTQESKQQLLIRVDNTSKTSQVLEENIKNIDYRVINAQEIIVYQSSIDYNLINKILIENNIDVYEFKIEVSNLEDYFLNIKRGDEID
ncbi:ABC transporter ATP-binding protein [Staphylococcus epidermidis]|jgi:ABC-type multidrug transport system, ATPase component|uniref:ABC transporter ATP-binding protein n=1 Tax=Staphylococcus epidermidis TaxID=1282 RepID=UPI0002432DF0|nr:ABC transporter ATP-binding protein [Staphylococcus epidermidis]EHM69776.1 ABC transporter, ATP-binding protein [Staphylococcus epidermidis VCU071]KAB2191995.1 ABC transporter ATP-binding protein [Staphylococcus epidermidis]MBC3169132.1 ABC transporter ATP-binding protein [Staphylococcus epidermidis]MBE0334684.1 ABC transporter ATP-binding protein [Staphylococcus epidermidis]MBM0766725.1 ABC transporter ATP-binding protein [Staphylococcus epidermidis]